MILGSQHNANQILNYIYMLFGLFVCIKRLTNTMFCKENALNIYGKNSQKNSLVYLLAAQFADTVYKELKEEKTLDGSDWVKSNVLWGLRQWIFLIHVSLKAWTFMAYEQANNAMTLFKCAILVLRSE